MTRRTSKLKLNEENVRNLVSAKKLVLCELDDFHFQASKVAEGMIKNFRLRTANFEQLVVETDS